MPKYAKYAKYVRPEILSGRINRMSWHWAAASSWVRTAAKTAFDIVGKTNIIA
jgi:hypothetical protein